MGSGYGSGAAMAVANQPWHWRLPDMVKLAEIGIMLITSAGFFLHNAGLLLSALFLMGTHSTFFGPLKYAVLPQYLKQQELVGGNGLIEMGTFLAILLGQIIGSLMMRHDRQKCKHCN